jgi:hypothetical protein
MIKRLKRQGLTNDLLPRRDRVIAAAQVFFRNAPASNSHCFSRIVMLEFETPWVAWFPPDELKMLLADKLRIEQLTSRAETTRVQAAIELGDLEPGHFEQHPFDPNFVRALESGLIAAFGESADDRVRVQVLQAFAGVALESDAFFSMVTDALQPECSFLPHLLYYVWRITVPRAAQARRHPRFTECKEQVKALSRHSDPQVRWRCALVLQAGPLDYDRDIEVIRSLMVDEHATARTHAVLAFKKLGRVETLDRAVLNLVESLDQGAARVYARQLLAASKTPLACRV